MRIMFTVQGDGRGHMTQAMSAARMLERHGHEVVAVTVGTSPGRAIPAFLTNAFGDRLMHIDSPGFGLANGRGISTLATLRSAACGLGRFRRSLATIGDTISKARPDLIVNFLEPLMGAYSVLRPHGVPIISVGHHFMLGHPSFVRSHRFLLQQLVMRRYVGLAGSRSTHLALSFYPAPSLPERGTYVCPPLLRREVFDLPQDRLGTFLLAYVLNQGYTEDIRKWHASHPEVSVHCFCERPKVTPVWYCDETLSFHQLDGARFLRMMAESRGVACTAGFESVNEAAWLGKPLMVVPVENHVEQHLNAMDAEKAGLAVSSASFDLSPLLNQRVNFDLDAYRGWVRRAEPMFMSVVESVTHVRTRTILGLSPLPEAA